MEDIVDKKPESLFLLQDSGFFIITPRVVESVLQRVHEEPEEVLGKHLTEVGIPNAHLVEAGVRLTEWFKPSESDQSSTTANKELLGYDLMTAKK